MKQTISLGVRGSIYQAESKEYAKYHMNPLQTRIVARLDPNLTPNLRGVAFAKFSFFSTKLKFIIYSNISQKGK